MALGLKQFWAGSKLSMPKKLPTVIVQENLARRCIYGTKDSTRPKIVFFSFLFVCLFV